MIVGGEGSLMVAKRLGVTWPTLKDWLYRNDRPDLVDTLVRNCIPKLTPEQSASRRAA
jgi:cell pole-organizing protein PopZ